MSFLVLYFIELVCGAILFLGFAWVFGGLFSQQLVSRALVGLSGFIKQPRMGKDKQAVEKFDGSDYGFWRMQIEDLLYVKDLYKPLKGVKPESEKQEDWDLMDWKVQIPRGNHGLARAVN